MLEPPITSKTTVRALAHHPLFRSITPLELVIYLGLIVSAGPDGISTATNAQLKPGYINDARPVVSAIRKLADRGLVKVTYGYGAFGRRVQVVR